MGEIDITLLKRKLEEQRGGLSNIIDATDVWLNLARSLPAHSHDANVESFIDKGQAVQARCCDLIGRIDELQQCEADILEQEIGRCWKESHEVGLICDTWRQWVDAVISRFDAFLSSPLGGTA